MHPEAGTQRHALVGLAHTLRSRVELGGLVLLGLVAGALWVFAAVADEVVEGETRDFDRTVVESLRSAEDPSDPWGPLWVEEMARDYSALGGVAVLLLLTAGSVAFLALQGHRRTSLYVLAVIALGMLASLLLKELFDRPRPEVVPRLSPVHTSSFPSGHSMMSALTYLTLAGLVARHQRRRRVRAFLMASAALSALLVGASRVYLGVHYPTDVVAGWTAGAAWALACLFLARWLGRRGELEPEAAEEASGAAAAEPSRSGPHSQGQSSKGKSAQAPPATSG